MRLGIFGGSFDPVHYGHLLLAECCREQLELDEVWFLPAAIPPHKQSRELAPAAARAEMLELAAAGHAAFRVCRYEIDRGGVNYTADTLAHLKNEDPTRELFFLMGADSLHDLATWKDPARLCELATPIAVGRGDVKPDARDLDWSGLQGLVSPERLAAMRDLVAGWFSSSFILTVVGYVIVLGLLLEVAGFPLAFYRGVTLERRYGLSTQTTDVLTPDVPSSSRASECQAGPSAPPGLLERIRPLVMKPPPVAMSPGSQDA